MIAFCKLISDVKWCWCTTEDQLSDNGDDELKNFVLDEFDQPERHRETRKDADSNTMGLRYPIWMTACSHKQIHYQLAAPGTREKDTEFVNLGALSQPMKEDKMTTLQRHPYLKYLSSQVVRYLQNFHYVKLGLQVR